ncbi:MAG: type II toxin-antitoxin system RelE/ParE family toxin [Rhizobiaceae bacterium]
MITFVLSDEFRQWLHGLTDDRGRARIVARIRSAEHGNFGDHKPIESGVSEMRIHHGPGYRLYYSRQGDVVYLLLIGGEKSTQKQDIKRALEMLKKVKSDSK